MTQQGGNRIPAKWFADWRRKHGFDKPAPVDDQMPAWLGKWIDKELGK